MNSITFMVCLPTTVPASRVTAIECRNLKYTYLWERGGEKLHKDKLEDRSKEVSVHSYLYRRVCSSSFTFTDQHQVTKKMPKYKLIYFDIRALGEPIRLLFHYMGKEFEDYRVPREEWTQLKSKVPFGKLPILEIDDQVFHQSTAILRYLAIEAGLAGDNASENLQIDMVVGAFGDLATEISKFFKMENPTDKEKLRQTIINESVPFYMTRFEQVLKNNGGYLANGKLSWAELYVVGYSSSLNGLIGIDLTEKYPFFKELTDRVHSLPGIKEWVKRRPDTTI